MALAGSELFVDQAALELEEVHLLVSSVLGLKECATTPSLLVYFCQPESRRHDFREEGN